MTCKQCNNTLEENHIFCPTCGARADGKKNCKNCQSLIAENDIFCPTCGVRVDGKEFCSNCQAEYKENQNFCAVCGTPRGEQETETQYLVKRKSGKGKALFAKGVAFENKTHYVKNGIGILLFLAMFITSFFGMIKLDMSSLGVRSFEGISMQNTTTQYYQAMFSTKFSTEKETELFFKELQEVTKDLPDDLLADLMGNEELSRRQMNEVSRTLSSVNYMLVLASSEMISEQTALWGIFALIVLVQLFLLAGLVLSIIAFLRRQTMFLCFAIIPFVLISVLALFVSSLFGAMTGAGAQLVLMFVLACVYIGLLMVYNLVTNKEARKNIKNLVKSMLALGFIFAIFGTCFVGSAKLAFDEGRVSSNINHAIGLSLIETVVIEEENPTTRDDLKEMNRFVEEISRDEKDFFFSLAMPAVLYNIDTAENYPAALVLFGFTPLLSILIVIVLCVLIYQKVSNILHNKYNDFYTIPLLSIATFLALIAMAFNIVLLCCLNDTMRYWGLDIYVNYCPIFILNIVGFVAVLLLKIKKQKHKTTTIAASTVVSNSLNEG